MKHRIVAAALSVGLAFLLGCGGPGAYDVEGTVTLDGEPMKEGDVTFIPEDTKHGPDAGKITDGKYRLRSKGGKMKVEIRGYREVPGKKGPMGNEPLLEPAVAPEYNDRSTLSAEVGPGKTRFDFAVKSPAKK